MVERKIFCQDLNDCQKSGTNNAVFSKAPVQPSLTFDTWQPEWLEIGSEKSLDYIDTLPHDTPTDYYINQKMNILTR